VKLVANSDAITADDRGFNYGDGIFTTMCVMHQQVQLLPYHLSRLMHDAKVLSLQLDEIALTDAITRYVASLPSSPDKVVVKVHISSGTGGRGYARDVNSPSLVRFTTHDFPIHYEHLKTTGMTVICAATALAIQPLLGGVKHLNRLEQVFVKREVLAAGVDDGLVCDMQGNIIEASAGNLFFKNSTGWHTPQLHGSGVNGVVRACLLDEMIRAGINVMEGEYVLNDVKSAQALLITNALMGVMPVSKLQLPNDEGAILYSDSLQGCAQLTSLLDRKIQDVHANSN